MYPKVDSKPKDIRYVADIEGRITLFLARGFKEIVWCYEYRTKVTEK